MASSDVIELGSSDDEAEPIPKKKKPTLNAMVRFPKEMPELVIKPVKTLPNLHKVLAGGSVTITNVKLSKVNPHVNKVKSNRSVQKPVVKTPLKMPVIKHAPATHTEVKSNLSLNPLSFVKNAPIVRLHNPKMSLPPGIIVKRAVAGQKISNIVGSKRKRLNIMRNCPPKIITTVELDDEEVPLTHGTSPQWYLRPEEQTNEQDQQPQPTTNEKETGEPQDHQNDVQEKLNGMEVDNNKEPDTSNYIEIIIEDSPIKPLKTTRGFEIGSQLPITIDDSPIKSVSSMKEQPCLSDNEVEKIRITEPQSKKRLDYPKDEEDIVKMGQQNFVEIDLEPLPSSNQNKEQNIENKISNMVDETVAKSEVLKVDTCKRMPTVLITKDVKDKEKLDYQKTSHLPIENNENLFHPIYQKFIDLCFKLENSDDMTKIVEKKIKTYYRQCPKEYVQSEEFTDMVSSKISAMKAAPDKMYLYIKDIVDELNMQRKTAKALEAFNKEHKKSGNDDYSIAVDVEYDSKRARQIRKLDKTIKKLHRAVQKLEEQEVDFEDEEDSVYLLTERYKERLIRVYAKFCQVTNIKMPSVPRIQIEARPGQPTGPAKRLEKWVNKKVPVGKPLPFPDFHDVLRCVRDSNDEDRLGWNEADIMEEARDLFTRCGKKLQRRRQENEWRIAAARLSQDVSCPDPAEDSDYLKKKLEENKAFAAKKEIELLNKYADKQNQLKLVGEEIGDREADESPVESEDDDGNDECDLLEDKEKRKKRLKRLLHEKTRKLSSEKESVSNENESEIIKEAKQMDYKAAAVTEQIENKEKEDAHGDTNLAKVIIDDTPPVEDGPSHDPELEIGSDQNQEKSNSNSYDVDSDIDELHLLQKLYSENEINSSAQSDSDTPISIYDTLDSDSDTENPKIHQNDDIISIENSSYSESEMTKDESDIVSASASTDVKDGKIDRLLLKNKEIRLYSTLNNRLCEEDENILLASSGEENYTDTRLHADNAGNVLENDPKEVSQSKENIYEPIKLNTSCQNGNLSDIHVKIISGDINEEIGNDSDIVEPKSTEIFMEKDKENFEMVSCANNVILVTDKAEGNETICITDKEAAENKENRNCAKNNYKPAESYIEDDSVVNQKSVDKSN